jgi:hypothetical protein
MITLSPAHQNPTKAPPTPIDLSLDQYYNDAANGTESSAGITPNDSRNPRRGLLSGGPLRCKNGPCADDR